MYNTITTLYRTLVNSATVREAMQALETAKQMQDEEITDLIKWVGKNTTYDSTENVYKYVDGWGRAVRLTEIGVYDLYLKNKKNRNEK